LERKEKPTRNRKGNKVITKTQLTIEKNKFGGYIISAIIGGYLVTRKFSYYTKREAARLFLNEVNGKKEATK
jgi:hypothetical protein